ncbi:cell envelope-related function transcriptional attenuator common domain-containing protein [Parafrankia irregularis]|uniref:Cell envelope-related function transcriptional attenuator common domain-containing protein n=1 Tax=Parafrankia irregularis TaxID=795642 RepID=A0A0S4QDY0_9ACTN|nr:cell envelope-related function transcriptional attenuator common domain-containing protein [Parafrankia irregularis]
MEEAGTRPVGDPSSPTAPVATESERIVPDDTILDDAILDGTVLDGTVLDGPLATAPVVEPGAEADEADPLSIPLESTELQEPSEPQPGRASRRWIRRPRRANQLGVDGIGRPAPRGPLRRALLVLTSLLSLVVIAITATGWLVVTFYDRRIDRETIAPPADMTVTRPPSAPVGSETWLLVGSDIRTGSDAAKVGGARSDTMMIAHLASDGTTQIVSIPRDLRVPIPAWTDDDGDRHRARADKVNAAFSAGGPALLVATLEQVAGVRIDHYAELDFGGFRQMTAAIGGIDVCLNASTFVERHTLDNGRTVRSTNLNDPSSGFVGQVGVNHLSGENALAFVRQRHGFADGDLSRIRRQQAFLAAMFRTVLSENVLLSPSRLTSFLGAVTESVLLDDQTGFSELRELAERMRGMTTGAVTFSTVPITGQINSPVFYFLYDPAAMRQFFRDVTGSTTLFEPSDGPVDPLDLSAEITPSATAAAAGSTPAASTRPRATVTSPAPPQTTATPTPDTAGTTTEPGPSAETSSQPQATVTASATGSNGQPDSGGWPQPWPTALTGTTAAAGTVSWARAAAFGSNVTATGGAAPTGGATPTSPSPTASGAQEAPVTAAAACIY